MAHVTNNAAILHAVQVLSGYYILVTLKTEETATWEEMKLDPYLTPHAQFNLKWIWGLNVRAQTKTLSKTWE